MDYTDSEQWQYDLLADQNMELEQIRNELELAVVREQIVRAESALDAIRREVFPVNARLFAAMAEPYQDTIEELRRSIVSFQKANPKKS